MCYTWNYRQYYISSLGFLNHPDSLVSAEFYDRFQHYLQNMDEFIFKNHIFK